MASSTDWRSRALQWDEPTESANDNPGGWRRFVAQIVPLGILQLADDVGDSGPTRALVLSGGGARGAYEAGVLRYILDAVPEETGEPVDFDIICGTSVGAINTTWLAAMLHEPQRCGQRLWYLWRTLEFSDIIKPSYGEIWRLLRQLVQQSRMFNIDEPPEERSRRGGLIDTSFFRDLVREEIPFQHISRNLNRGLIDALAVSATDVVSGRTTIFAQTASGELPPWSRDPRRVAVAGPITADKVLASAAIPIIFPAIQIGGRWYSDGGLRQNTPLSPALRLGADRVMVVTLHNESPLPEPEQNPFEHPLSGPAQHYPNYLFTLGKLLDALLLDPLDYDLMVLERINGLLRQVEEAFPEEGSGVEHVNELMRAYRGMGYRIVEPQLIRPSKDLGQIASRFASKVPDDFWGSRLVAAVAKSAAERRGYGESDLLSYLLFDRGYTGQLLDLGYKDASDKHDEIVEFFQD